jgi:hypothetical protein
VLVQLRSAQEASALRNALHAKEAPWDAERLLWVEWLRDGVTMERIYEKLLGKRKVLHKDGLISLVEEDTSTSTTVPGLHLIEDFVSVEEEIELMNEIYSLPEEQWSWVKDRRAVIKKTTPLPNLFM